MEKLDDPTFLLIFENLDYDNVMKCRRVCKIWNETLRKLSDAKFLQEFGDIGYNSEVGKVSTRMEKSGDEIRS